MKRIAAWTLVAVMAVSATGCAKRQIDAEATGSVTVPGTHGTLKRFCDGNIAIYWTPSRGTESDDYEFIVYDSPFCGGLGTDGGQGPTQEVPEDDN